MKNLIKISKDFLTLNKHKKENSLTCFDRLELMEGSVITLQRQNVILSNIKTPFRSWMSFPVPQGKSVTVQFKKDICN